MGSLKSKFLYQLTASVLHALLPILTFPYVTRVLGPQNLGAINFVDYTAQIFITLANFGIPLYAVREIARVRESPSKLQKVVSELLTIHLFTTFIALLAFLLTMRFNQSDEIGQALLILASLNIFFNAFSLTWFVQGLEDFKTISTRSLAIKVFVTVLVFIFIHQAEDYIQYYLLLVLGSLLSVSYDIYYLKKQKVSLTFSVHSKKHIRPLFIFFLTTASISLYTLFDTFILGVITTTLAVGFYTTAIKIIRLFQGFVSTLGGVLLPRIAYLMEQKQETEISQLLHKSLLYVITIALPACILFYLLAPEIIMVLAGHEFSQAVTTLQILSILPFLIGLSNIFGIQVLVPFGKEKQLLLSAIIGCSSSIVLCVALIPVLRENGAATATLITEFLVTLVMFIYANRSVNMMIPYKSLLTVVLTILLFIPLVLGVRYILQHDFFVLITSLVLCILLYCLVQLYIFSNPILTELMNYSRALTLKTKSPR